MMTQANAVISGPVYSHGWTLIPASVSNNIHYNAWDEIPIHPQTAPVQVSGLIPGLIGHLITYLCLG